MEMHHHCRWGLLYENNHINQVCLKMEPHKVLQPLDDQRRTLTEGDS